MNEKDKVGYLQSKGWIPHPNSPERHWQSPNHNKKYLTYGTAMAYHSQKAFEEGATLKKIKAEVSVSKGMFWVCMIDASGLVAYAIEDGNVTRRRQHGVKFPDLKSAVAAANKVLEVNPKFGFWGFEAVRNA